MGKFRDFWNGLNIFTGIGMGFGIILLFLLVFMSGTTGWVIGNFDRNCEIEVTGHADLNASLLNNPLMDNNHFELTGFKLNGPCAPVIYSLWGTAYQKNSDDYPVPKLEPLPNPSNKIKISGV